MPVSVAVLDRSNVTQELAEITLFRQDGPKAERPLSTAVGETLIRWVLFGVLGAYSPGASLHFRRFCFAVRLA